MIAAIVAANEGHALAYGDDEWTRECQARFAELFGQAETLLTFTGTGGNVLGLSTLLRPVDAVVCAAGSHVNVDEAGAMERISGAKLIDLPAPDGKLVPEQLSELGGAARQRAPRPARRRHDHPEHRAGHRVHRRRGRRRWARPPTRWG